MNCRRAAVSGRNNAGSLFSTPSRRCSCRRVKGADFGGSRRRAKREDAYRCEDRRKLMVESKLLLSPSIAIASLISAMREKLSFCQRLSPLKSSACKSQRTPMAASLVRAMVVAKSSRRQTSVRNTSVSRASVVTKKGSRASTHRPRMEQQERAA